MSNANPAPVTNLLFIHIGFRFFPGRADIPKINKALDGMDIVTVRMLSNKSVCKPEITAPTNFSSDAEN